MRHPDLFQNHPLFPHARHILETLTHNGFRALIVGGAVRDALLGLPIKDLDIATNAHPEQVQNLFPHTLAIGASFGVIMVILNKQMYEVVTFRRDVLYQDGRHPQSVEYSDEREDALRRDFTINALMYDPQTGDIIDHVGGVTDIERRVIRAVGVPRERFQEDHLRMLRGVRFATRLQFPLETETRKAIVSMAPRIQTISAERIRDELIGILNTDHPDEGLQLADEVGLASEILQLFPESDELLERYRRLLATASLKPLTPADRMTALIIYLAHESDHVTHRLSQLSDQLRLPGSQRVRAVTVYEQLVNFRRWQQLRPADRIRTLRKPTRSLALDLRRHLFAEPMPELLEQIAYLDQRDHFPTPLLSGKDLVAAGFQPGPGFTTVLTEIESRQLEGTLQHREEALQLAASMLQPDAGPETSP